MPIRPNGPDLESTDGITWTERFPAGQDSFRDSFIEYKDKFYSVGPNNITVSDDGLTWETLEHSVLANYPRSYSGTFLVEGTLYISNGFGHLFWTNDGVNWEGQRLIFESTSFIREVTQYEGQILAIASNGQLYSQTAIPQPSSQFEVTQLDAFSFSYSTTVSDQDRLIPASETSTDLTKWTTEFLQSSQGSGQFNTNFSFKNLASNQPVFHRVSVIDRNKIRGLWSGVMETALTSGSNCLNSTPSERVTFQLDWFEDNNISINRRTEAEVPLFGQFIGNVNAETMEINLNRILNSACLETAMCQVSLNSEGTRGLRLKISWIEPNCDEEDCSFEKTLILFR